MPIEELPVASRNLKSEYMHIIHDSGVLVRNVNFADYSSQYTQCHTIKACSVVWVKLFKVH